MNKLLIIDSDVAATQSIQAALAAATIAIQATADGADGLDQARLDRPDCVIVSVELMRGSGYSVCNRLRRDPQIADLPLILVSREATEETFDQHRKLKTHADYYVKKPYDMAALLVILSQHLDLSALAQDATAPQPQPFVDDPPRRAVLAQGAPMSDERTAVFDVDLLPAGLPPQPEALCDVRGTNDAAPSPDDVDQGATRVVDLAALFGQAAVEALVETPNPGPTVPVLPEAMGSEDTHTYAVAPSQVHLPRHSSPHPTVRPVVQPGTHRPPPRRDTVSSSDPGQVRGSMPIEVLPDAQAESRAARAAVAAAAAPPPTGPRIQGQNTLPVQGVEVLRQDIRGLRQKVQELEGALESAELAHADRLVEESRRGHDSVELKAKIAQLEREALKVQEATARQKSNWEQTVTALAEARVALADGARNHLDLVRQHEALGQEHAALQASHADLTDQMEALHAAHTTLQHGHAGTLAAWQRARQAVDDTLQLIDSSGLIVSG